MSISSKEKIREIYEALPKFNCGLCGYGNCGQFARAVTEGRASPFGCRQNPWSGYRISEIIGVKVPDYGYESKPGPVPKSGLPSPLIALGEEVRGLSWKVDDILAKIENLKVRG